MAKYLKTKQPFRKSAKQKNNSSGASEPQSLSRVRKNIYRQIILTVLTVVLTVLLLFAMTSAWYTNVVQTSGLVFEAEAWGFDGTITVDEGSIQAAPGDDGLVQLTVENDSDAISAISVNVSKDEMNVEMRKRLFFYVDTNLDRNGESMERVYLNKYEGYTYNVFGKNQLTLTEQVSNAPVIKWEWVYDVLGYYILAQPYQITKEDDTTQTFMSIKEYLRPIEYDFDEATTVIKTEDDSVSIDISTVDGKTHPDAFLYQLSLKDGYKGYIDANDKQSFGNYYAVDVDENGYGVYAYLCNYSEIQSATAYDTRLGNLAYKRAKNQTLTPEELEQLTHTATLMLSAQKNESTTVNVSTLGGLRSAIALGTADIIQLSSDITIPAGETLTLEKGTQVMLDLNNHTITNMDGFAIQANPGSSLTVINGTMVNAVQGASGTCGVYSIGAEVVMSNVKVQDFQYGVYVSDHKNNNELDSRVYLLECNIEAETCAVFASGNGVLSDKKTQIIIEKCDLSSNAIVISGSGDATGNGKWGTDIQIINSNVHAGENASDYLGGGIYHPQKDSTLMVYGSCVSGYNGITIKGGTVSIMKSEITGKGKYQQPTFDNNGYTDTGDAVYIETNYGYEIQLKIGQGSELRRTTGESRSLRVYEVNAANVSVLIEDGVFDEKQPDAYIAEGSIQKDEEGKFVITSP